MTQSPIRCSAFGGSGSSGTAGASKTSNPASLFLNYDPATGKVNVKGLGWLDYYTMSKLAQEGKITIQATSGGKYMASYNGSVGAGIM